MNDLILKEINTKLEEMIPHLQGWSSLDKCKHIASLIVENKVKNSFDLGVFGGRGLLTMGVTHKIIGGRAYGVDPYSFQNCIDPTNDEENNKYWEEIDFTHVHRSMFGAMFHWELSEHAYFYRLESSKAVKLFEDGFFGLIHIDGNHSEKDSCQDIELWAPKTSSKGIIVMDDSNWASTQLAQKNLVDKFKFNLVERKKVSEGQEYAVYKKGKA